jgi:hypothetical protein
MDVDIDTSNGISSVRRSSLSYELLALPAKGVLDSGSRAQFLDLTFFSARHDP